MLRNCLYLFLFVNFLLVSTTLEAATCRATLKKILKNTHNTHFIKANKITHTRFKSNKTTIVESINTNGKMKMIFRQYLPEDFGSKVEISRSWDTKLGGLQNKWLEMNFDPKSKIWSFSDDSVPPNRTYKFRFKNNKNEWQEVTDFNAYAYSKNMHQVNKKTPGKTKTELFENYPTPNGLLQSKKEISLFDHMPVTPDLKYTRKFSPRRPTKALSIIEVPLNDLLPWYKKGILQPSSSEEFNQKSVIARLLDSDIIPTLKNRGFNAIQSPIQISAADLTHYNPTFSYLITGAGALDPHIGTISEFRKFLDVLEENGMEFIPDIIFAHKVRKTSEISEELIKNRQGKQLFTDPQYHAHQEYYTYMYDMENPEVRESLVDQVVRLIDVLGLNAFRFDYVDGMMMQYKNRPINYGQTFVKELAEKINKNFPHILGIGETFDAGGDKNVIRLNDMLYQPWSGYDLAAAINNGSNPKKLLTTKNYIPDLNNYVKAVNGMQTDTRASHLTMISDHDSLRPFPELTREGTAAHLGQLALEKGQRLIEIGLLEQDKLLDFVLFHETTAEAMTRFTSRHAHLETGHIARLGYWDDFGKDIALSGKGHQYLFNVKEHPQLDKWVKVTGLDKETIIKKIEQASEIQTRLRKEFTYETNVEYIKPSEINEFNEQYIPKAPAHDQQRVWELDNKDGGYISKTKISVTSQDQSKGTLVLSRRTPTDKAGVMTKSHLAVNFSASSQKVEFSTGQEISKKAIFTSTDPKFNPEKMVEYLGENNKGQKTYLITLSPFQTVVIND